MVDVTGIEPVTPCLQRTPRHQRKKSWIRSMLSAGETTSPAVPIARKRTYEFVMNGRFLHERNISPYPPQEKNPKGEVHEHWTMFSYDRTQ